MLAKPPGSHAKKKNKEENLLGIARKMEIGNVEIKEKRKQDDNKRCEELGDDQL